MENFPIELREDLLQEFKDAFLVFDHDADGEISAQDIENVLKAFDQKPTTDELKSLMEVIDQSGTGKITFIQFVKLLVLSQTCFDREETLRAVFLCFDRNGDGNIGPAELHYVMKTLGINFSRQDAEELLGEFGGVIGIEQFCKLFGRTEL